MEQTTLFQLGEVAVGSFNLSETKVIRLECSTSKV